MGEQKRRRHPHNQYLKGVPLEDYDIVLADPLYSVEDAEHYKTSMVQRNKVMRALAAGVKPGTHVGQLSFHRTVAPWVCDRNWHSSQKVKSVKGGAVIMTLRVAETAELVGWILSFGSNVRVLSPRSLRDRVHEEVRKILREA